MENQTTKNSTRSLSIT